MLLSASSSVSSETADRIAIGLPLEVMTDSRSLERALLDLGGSASQVSDRYEPHAFVDGGHVGMVQRGEELRLASEPCDTLGILREGRGENLDRDVAVELRVPCAENLAHSSRSERTEDLVGSEMRADGERARIVDE